jgi:hypothetical protein
MLWLTVRNTLVPQNVCLYKGSVVYTDVVISGFDCNFTMPIRVFWVLLSFNCTAVPLLVT